MKSWEQRISHNNSTESRAFKYLTQIKGLRFFKNKIRSVKKSDFISDCGQQFEIKRISYFGKNQPKIVFTKQQILNFSDDANILIFEPFANIPIIETKMKNIREKDSFFIKVLINENQIKNRKLQIQMR